MTSALDAIVFGLQGSQKLMHRMVDELKPEDFEKQPCEGGNCIAWILGHLTLTDRRTMSWFGVTEPPALPEGFEALFTTTRTVAGKQGGFHEPKLLIQLFDENRQLMIDAITKTDPAKLNEVTPMERPMFRTYGEYLVFMDLHTSLHIGQIRTIRRVLGYAPLS